MAKQEILLPKMGESITDATLICYTVAIGDDINEDDTIAEVATDKVDSEVPSPYKGTVVEFLYSQDDVIPIGQALLVIETSAPEDSGNRPNTPAEHKVHSAKPPVLKEIDTLNVATIEPKPILDNSASVKLSPLVQSIVKRERILKQELENIKGSGRHNRITKRDILAFVEERQHGHSDSLVVPKRKTQIASQPAITSTTSSDVTFEMDRMRKIIADHMVMSKHTAPHVSTFLEVDVTNIVKWRKRNKDQFLKLHNSKLTYTPIFFLAVAKAIVDFPGINASVNVNQITIKKDINIGMAAALPTGNLIVPVIKNAESYNLIGMAKTVNDLAERARTNKLKPDEIQGGTFTISNLGTFGNDSGTPIINQPQAAILAIGAINKKPAVIETEEGDMIAIRSKMKLSLSFDHRIIDGNLGGSFLRRVGDNVESFQMENINATS